MSHLFVCRSQRKSPLTIRQDCSAISLRLPWKLKIWKKYDLGGNIWKKQCYLWKGPSLISLCLTPSAVVCQLVPTCLFCQIIMRSLMSLLPAERTEVSHTHAVKEHTCTRTNTVSLCPAHRQHCRQSGGLTLTSILHPALLQAVVVEALEKVCHILPSFLEDKCDAIVQMFGKELVDALLTYATPQVVCTAIRMCRL